MRLEPNPTNACFGCGGANSRGMQLTFEQDDAARRIRGMFRVGAGVSGRAGICPRRHHRYASGRSDGQGEPVPRGPRGHRRTERRIFEAGAGRRRLLSSRAGKSNGRGAICITLGEIRDASGVLLARGKGRFVEIDPSRITAVARRGKD